jgi:ATP-GRASP peptide maturase of grasp-with-spasm system
MILILTDEHEATTDLVIDWLVYLKKNFIRISLENNVIVEKIYYDENFQLNALLKIKKNNDIIYLDTKNISSYWYRRSNININIPKIGYNNKITEQLTDYLFSEYGDVQRIIGFILNSKNRINKYSDNDISKIEELTYANKCGLKTPDFVICSDKKTFLDFYKKHKGNVITKTIGDPSTFFRTGLHWFTNKVNLSDVPKNFALSLFQEMIKKSFELRIFYLKGKCYSSAIFSQNDKQTQIDFRHYNNKKPNRVIPYKLPKEIESKISKFMNLSNLNSGSIDMILTPNNEYYFLEVNPIGQFEQVSIPCNYNLFKKIADIL